MEVEMGLAAVNSGTEALPRLDLDVIQLEQFKHDETYHREIARLSMQDRLRHMTLHFGKYAGNLAESGEDETVFRKVVTDTFIIAVSTANTLNVRLSDVLSDATSAGIVDRERPFGTALTIHAGRMAAACEKLDHLEDFAFRAVVRERTISLVQAAIAEAERRGWGIAELVRTRLAGVKQKMIFHGQV